MVAITPVDNDLPSPREATARAGSGDGSSAKQEFARLLSEPRSRSRAADMAGSIHVNDERVHVDVPASHPRRILRLKESDEHASSPMESDLQCATVPQSEVQAEDRTAVMPFGPLTCLLTASPEPVDRVEEGLPGLISAAQSSRFSHLQFGRREADLAQPNVASPIAVKVVHQEAHFAPASGIPVDAVSTLLSPELMPFGPLTNPQSALPGSNARIEEGLQRPILAAQSARFSQSPFERGEAEMTPPDVASPLAVKVVHQETHFTPASTISAGAGSTLRSTEAMPVGPLTRLQTALPGSVARIDEGLPRPVSAAQSARFSQSPFGRREADVAHPNVASPVAVKVVRKDTHLAPASAISADVVSTPRTPEGDLLPTAATANRGISRGGEDRASPDVQQLRNRAEVATAGGPSSAGPENEMGTGFAEIASQVAGPLLEVLAAPRDGDAGSRSELAPRLLETPSSVPRHVSRTLKIQLAPEALGSVNVVLSTANASLSVRLEVERSATAAHIEADLGALTDRLNTSGYEVAELVVSSAPASMPVNGQMVDDPNPRSTTADRSYQDQHDTRQSHDGSERRPGHPQLPSDKEREAPGSINAAGPEQRSRTAGERYLGARTLRTL